MTPSDPQITRVKAYHNGDWFDVTELYQSVSPQPNLGDTFYLPHPRFYQSYLCTCKTHPLACPQGRALVQAILDRKESK